ADGEPGDGASGTKGWTVADYMARTARLLRALFEDLGGATSAPAPSSPPDDVMGGIARFARLGEIATLTGMAQAAGLLEVVLGAQRMQPDGVLFRLLD